MKKKLLSLCLVLALGTTAVIGGTLAYFTDTDDAVKNTFTIGNIDIDLWEYTDEVGTKEDEQGNPIPVKDQDGYNYENLMPTQKLTKEPYVENLSTTNAAYVRAVITMNNHAAMNKAIDEVYELTDANLTTEQKLQPAQDMYTKIFDGWGINHFAKKDNVEGYENSVRHAMAQRTSSEEGVEVLAIDSVRCPYVGAGYQWNEWNTFKKGTETTSTTCATAKNDTSTYYTNAVADDSVTYVLYLKLDAGKQYKLFDGLNVPAEFTGEQMKMFEGLKINIYADAIQTEGFDSYVDAFNALEAEHPLGYWNT